MHESLFSALWHLWEPPVNGFTWMSGISAVLRSRGWVWPQVTGREYLYALELWMTSAAINAVFDLTGGHASAIMADAATGLVALWLHERRRHRRDPARGLTGAKSRAARERLVRILRERRHPRPASIR